jgi:hypothetical protein
MKASYVYCSGCLWHSRLGNRLADSVQTRISFPGFHQDVCKVRFRRHKHVRGVNKVVTDPFRRIDGLFHENIPEYCVFLVANIDFMFVDVFHNLLVVFLTRLEPNHGRYWFLETQKGL